MWITALLVAGMQLGLLHASKGFLIEPMHSALLRSPCAVRLDEHYRRPNREIYSQW
jgi:hypothetical protein